MIEELTPQVLMSTMFLIIVAAPALTLLLSVLLLWRYRQTVESAMQATGSFHPSATITASAPTRRTGNRTQESAAIPISGEFLFRRAIRTPVKNICRYALAGLAFALVFAVAAGSVYPSGLGLPGFLIAVWIYVWPVFLAAPLIVPATVSMRITWFIAYLVVFSLLGLWAGSIENISGYRFGAIELPARSSVTPEGMAKLWLVVNGAPTLLILLCLNRRVRAVAPLMLSLVTATIAGALASMLTLFSARGVDVTVAASMSLDLHVLWLVLAVFLASLAAFGAIGWLLSRWIARAYQQGQLSDQSLMFDALWLLFASTYSMWLLKGGIQWVMTVPAAFLAFKLTWAAFFRYTTVRKSEPVDLTFLRVFSLGQRSEELLELVANYWRAIGNVQMITGPDLARSTVQPHQFLDFISGNIGWHFIADSDSLQRRMAARNRSMDPDGRFRINNFFCHADSWKAVLSRLVQEGDTVLMDLRSFTAANAGCIHELNYLVAGVPVERCLLIVDAGTDEQFLDEVLLQAWTGLPVDSPNHGCRMEALQRYRFEACPTAVRRVIHRLCMAAGVSAGSDWRIQSPNDM